MEGKEQLLQHVMKYITLDPAGQEVFAAAFTEVRIKKKQYLLREGEIANTTNFVLHGCLRSYYRDENGFAHVLMFAVEDRWISDLYSFVYNEPSTLFIDALEDTVILQASREVMDGLFVELPQLERFFRILTQKALANIQQRLLGNISKSATERYLDFRKKLGFLEGRLPQHQVASYLGVTPEFLSIIRKKLATQHKK